MICYLSFFADRQGEYWIAFIDYEGCCPSFFCYGAVDQFVNATDGGNRIRIRPILPIYHADGDLEDTDFVDNSEFLICTHDTGNSSVRLLRLRKEFPVSYVIT